MPFKKRFEFWLNFDKPEQVALAEKIDVMKERRQFAPNVRDGLLLMEDLRAGNVETLLQLFPDIRERLSVPAPEPVPDPKEQRLADALELLATAIKSTGHAKPALSGALPGAVGKPLELEAVPEVKVRESKQDSGQSSQNFLNSLMSLQS
jgi:hypothetical protein